MMGTIWRRTNDAKKNTKLKNQTHMYHKARPNLSNTILSFFKQKKYLNLAKLPQTSTFIEDFFII